MSFQIIDTGRAKNVQTDASLNTTIALTARLTGQPERVVEVALEFNTPSRAITRIPPKAGAGGATGVKIIRA